MSLGLSRKKGEWFLIADAIVTVVGVEGKVRLGIAAPSGIPVLRSEVLGKMVDTVLQAKDLSITEREELEEMQILLLDAEPQPDRLIACLKKPTIVELVWGSEFAQVKVPKAA